METARILDAVTNRSQSQVASKPYDMRRLSYAGTFKNPTKVLVIRTIECC
jgi:hypothetical protein